MNPQLGRYGADCACPEYRTCFGLGLCAYFDMVRRSALQTGTITSV